MPRKIEIEISDETLAKIKEYCGLTGETEQQIFDSAACEYICNDILCQRADWRETIELNVYRSRRAAANDAARYWAWRGDKKWEWPLTTTIKRGKEKVRLRFESPAPLPDNVFRTKNGGLVSVDPDISDEKLERILSECV